MRTLLVVVSLALLVSMGAFAQTPVDCSTIFTIADFRSVDSCIDQDKIYTYVPPDPPDSELPGDVVLGITTQTIGGIDYHTVRLSRPTGGIIDDTYTFSYTIAVDLLNEPYRRINSVELSAEYNPVSNAGAVSKTATDIASSVQVANLVWSGSNVTQTGFLSTALSITHTFEANSSWQSTTDTYTQTVVPEPSTLALMGGGLVLVGLLRRRFSR